MKRFPSAFFLCLTLLVSISASEAATVRFAGRVANGSRNEAAAGALVRLIRVDAQGGKSQTLATTKTDARGKFDLGQLILRDNDLLFSRVEWQGYPYIAPAYDGGKQLGELKVSPQALALRVFDTTIDDTPLTMTAQHVAIKTEGQKLKCIERMVVENAGKRTFLGTGKQGITVLLPLPQGAQEVRVDPQSGSDAKLVKIGNVYGVAKPIMPAAAGERNAIIISYTMPWGKNGIDLSRRLQYPARFFFVAREETDRKLKIEAPQLGKDQDAPVPIEGAMQTRIVNSIGGPMLPTAALKPGEMVSIKVSRPVNVLVWAFVAFVGALFLVVPLALVGSRHARRAPRQSPAPARVETSLQTPLETSSEGNLEGNLKSLEPDSQASVIRRILPPRMPAGAQTWIDQIAQLDDQWEAGAIERDDYLERRARVKNKVVDALSASRETS